MTTKQLGLEAALAASWDRETLAVYADHLQAEGDPRGELIALDLELASRSTPDLVARRASLLTGWLGRLVPSDPHTPWIGDSFRFGFVEDLVLDGGDPMANEHLARMLASPLAPYLKKVTVRGDSAHATTVLRELAELRHEWLSELALRTWSGEPIASEVIDGFVEATPILRALDIHGARVTEAFVHPTVHRLRVTGATALPGIFDEAKPMDSVRELDFALAQPYDPEHYNYGEEAPGPVAPLVLPALERLDLARNAPVAAAYEDPEIDYEPEEQRRQAPLEFLLAQPIRAQLSHLRLRSIESRAELDLLERVAASMPALQQIEIARGHYLTLPPKLAKSKAVLVRPAPWAWPPLDQIPVGDAVHVLVPGSRSGDTVPIADAAAIMERRFEGLDADARYAWTRFWTFVAELGALPWKSDPTRTWTDDRTFPAHLLVGALEACEIGGSGGWRELRDELRFRRPMPVDAMLVIHRVRTL